MSNSTTTIAQMLLGSHTFVVPDYQRPYSWDVKQIEELFYDIIGHIENKEQNHYLLGQTIIHKVETEENGEVKTIKYIVDGQQRLASITLFGCVIRDTVIENYTSKVVSDCTYYISPWIGINNDFKLILGEMNREFFRQYVQMKIHDTVCDSLNKNLKDNYERLKQLLEEYIKDDDVEGTKICRLAETISYKIDVSEVETTNEKLAYVFFERLNTRGKDLETADLVKNMLFSNLDEKHISMKKQWSDMYEKLFTEGLNPSDFIRCFWNTKNKSCTQEKLFDELVAEYVKDKCTKVPLFSFFTEMFNSVNNYLIIARPDSYRGKEGTKAHSALVNLKIMNAKTFFPLALSLLNKGETPKNISRVLLNVERLWIRNSVTDENPNKTEKEMSKLAHEFTLGNVSVDDICTSIQKLIVSDEKLKGDFNKFKCTRNVGKMILAQMFNKCNSELQVNSDGSDLHLEHIMPQTLSKDWGYITVEDHKEYKWYLGNLTLLGAGANIQIKNKSFEIKKAEYAKSLIPQTKSIVNYDKWTKVEIVDRQQKLFNDFIKVWPSKEKK